MGARQAWGYSFDCDHALPAMAAILNGSSPWVWQLRDSTWFGDYLTSSDGGCRARIHDPWQATEVKPVPGPGPAEEGGRYRITIEIGPGAVVERAEFDRVVQGLLARLGARRVAACEPFD